MMWPLIGSIIGAGSSLLGGIMGSNNASQQFWQNVKMQNRAMKKQQKWNKLSYDFANKWANINARRSTMAWRVRDAKSAGIHPLYALGGSSQVGVSSPSFSVGGGTAGYSGDGGLASSLNNAGQHLSRAFDAAATQSQRVEARMVPLLNVENMQLQNDLLRSQISRMNAPHTAPAISDRWLVDGQGDTSLLVKENPLKRVVSDPGRPFSEPGAITDVGYSRTVDGGYAPVPSADVKERIEDNIIQEVMWSLRNNLLPSLQTNMAPPYSAPHGSAWYFNPITQSYKLQSESGWRGAVDKFGRYMDYLRR